MQILLAKPTNGKQPFHNHPSPTSQTASKVTFNLDGIEEAVANLNDADLLEHNAEEEILIT
jgi:hypothetical protein